MISMRNQHAQNDTHLDKLTSDVEDWFDILCPKQKNIGYVVKVQLKWL